MVGGDDGGGGIQPTSLTSIVATLTVSIVVVTSTSVAWNTPNVNCTLADYLHTLNCLFDTCFGSDRRVF